MNVLHRITARRTTRGVLCIWIAYSDTRVMEPIKKTIPYETISDNEVAALLHQLRLPKQKWYWSLRKYRVPMGVNVRLTRKALHQDENGELMTWEDGFAAFIAYARML